MWAGLVQCHVCRDVVMGGRWFSQLHFLLLLLGCFAKPKYNAIIERRLTHSQLTHSRQAKVYQIPGDPVEVSLDINDVVFEVDPEFLSVTIDAGQISNNWSEINFTAPRVINMAKGLNPAMLRVGGTSADFLLFNETTSTPTSNGDYAFLYIVYVLLQSFFIFSHSNQWRIPTSQ